MSELLPYENELANQLQNLPLPDENKAWADMKRRLDEDDDNITPVWWRSCALWSLVGLILVVTGWMFIKYERNIKTKQPTEKLNTAIKEETKQNNTHSIIATPDTFNRSSNNAVIIVKSCVSEAVPDSTVKPETMPDRVGKATSRKYLKEKQSFLKTTLAKPTTAEVKINSKTPSADNNSTSQTTANYSKTRNRKLTKPGHIKIKTSNPDIDNTNNDQSATQIKNKRTTIDEINNNTIDRDTVTKPIDDIKRIVHKDSIQKNNPDTVQKKNEPTKISSKEKKKENSIKQPIWFSAGIALNQQLPIAGQTLTSYNAEGRKGNLADYIPSVYARMYKGNKWFIQAEFRYGAPQNTKDIIFQQRKEVDSIGQQFSNATSSHLRKTYYNQLPVTFHYFVLSNWSVGAGFIWNKFTSAVSEQEITQHNNITDSNFVLSKNIVINKGSDSNFVSSYFQYILETQYKWKKLSLGIRYTFGLQPYLKFTLQGGTPQQDKSQSFLLFIRYELWRSKRK